jgi:hypothetical protein
VRYLYLETGIRCLLGTVFLISCCGKLVGRGAFGAFVASVRGMRVLPPVLARPVALAVVAAEAAVCLLVAVPARSAALAGFAVAAGLLAVFTAGIVLARRRGVRAPCRCFGPSRVPLGSRQVVRNAVLAAVAVTGLVAAAERGSGRPAAMVAAALGGALLGGLVALLDDIQELFQPVDGGRAPHHRQHLDDKGIHDVLPDHRRGTGRVVVRVGPDPHAGSD